MLRYHEKKRKADFENLLDKKKKTAKHFLLKRRRQLASVTLLFVLCIVAFFVFRNSSLQHIMPFNAISSESLDRISEDAFRKIIGYDYGERIYAMDTVEIRSRLEASDMILGDIQFSVNFFRKLNIKFKETKPLFVLMPRSSESVPLVYSDKGKVYPYNVNVADLPIVEIKKLSEIHLATAFLNEMKNTEPSLYERVSQTFPCEDKSQIIVFFNDVNFKTKFSLEDSYWKTAFRHYRQLARNMRISNLDSVSVLDLRFKQLAYTSTSGGIDGC
jgi:cell division septal protein FtsQ